LRAAARYWPAGSIVLVQRLQRPPPLCSHAMAAVLRSVGGLPFSALRLTLRLLRRIQRGPTPRHLLPVAGLDHERAAPVLFALREAAHEAEVSSLS
jgi:hypothetical protein